MLGSVTVTKLNIRAMPNGNSGILGTLPEGTLVEVSDRNSGWLEIQHNGAPAFIASRYVDLYDHPPPLSAVIKADRLNVRSIPGLEGERLGTLTYGTTVNVLSQSGGWLEVPFHGRSAYISRAYTQLVLRGPVAQGIVTANLLNVRAEPNISAKVIGQLPEAMQVTVNAQLENWLEIPFANGRGFVSGNYVDLMDNTNTGPDLSLVDNEIDDDELDESVPPESDDEEASLAPLRKLPVRGPAPERLVAQTWNRYGGLLTPLSEDKSLDVASTVAVLSVESAGRGFDSGNQGRMLVRFENHKFWKYWGHTAPGHFDQHFRYRGDKVWLGHQWRPDANGEWRSFHGNQEAEWQVLNFARGINEEAALMSISMGAPQIMGFNYRALGYHSVQEMFDDFRQHMGPQIRGLFNFMSPAMIQRLRRHNFRGFAALYNGNGQQEKYGRKIEQHYAAYKRLS